MELGQWIVIGLCVLLFLWFVAGYVANARRLRGLALTIPPAVKPYGGVSTYRRLGNSGAQFIISKGAGPFRQMEIVFLLEPRENLLLWAFDRTLGRRDTLNLRANLRSVPEEEILVGRQGNREFTARLQREGEKPYEPMAAPPGLQAARRGEGDGMVAPRLGRLLERQGEVLQLLAVRHSEPHLIVRARLAPDAVSSTVTLLGELVAFVGAKSPAE